MLCSHGRMKEPSIDENIFFNVMPGVAAAHKGWMEAMEK